MRKSKFTEEQIAMALRQAGAGTPVAQICRKLGIGQSTFFRWKKSFGGLGVPELRELRQLWLTPIPGQSDGRYAAFQHRP